MSAVPTFEPGRVHDVPIDAIAPDPEQPRTTFLAKPLEELAANIKARGILQPITARVADDGALLIKSGERRWRAARLAGLESVPVLIALEHEPEADRLVDQVVENELRQSLSPLELAAAFAKLRDGGMSPAQIRKHLQAHGLDYARSTISNTLRLLELPDWAKALVEKGELGAAHARQILRAKDHPTWLADVREGHEQRKQWSSVDGPITVSDMEHIVDSSLHSVGHVLDSSWDGAKFDWKTVCKDCPHLVEHGNYHYCLNAPEFERRQAEAEASGKKARPAPEAKKPETDPTKVKPRKVKENADGVVSLKGKEWNSYKALTYTRFDAAKKCEGCPHKHPAANNGRSEHAADYCFYPACFDHLELQAQKDKARIERFKEALDELVLPVLQDRIGRDEFVQPALVAYVCVGQPLAARQPTGPYVPRNFTDGMYHVGGARVIWNLSQALDAYKTSDPGDGPDRDLGLIALSVLHHEQRRELARWCGIKIEDFYRPTETLAKLYKKDELVELIDPNWKETGWKPSLPSRPVGELQQMFVDGDHQVPAALAEIWNSPIANVVEDDEEHEEDDGAGDEEAAA